jgi:hypothetical protein
LEYEPVRQRIREATVCRKDGVTASVTARASDRHVQLPCALIG